MPDFSSQNSYTLRSMIQGQDRFVVAHRGSSGTAPENTMASMQRAVDAGAIMVEVDVQLTRDHCVIVMHDPTLGRTTNGSGIIRSRTFDELKTLDAGSWFNPMFMGEKIPLLTDALQFLKEHNTCVNIEIKPPQKDDDHISRLQAIIECVNSLQMEEVTLFSSFHHESLRYIKIHHSAFLTAGIHLPGDKRLPSEIAGDIGCDGFVCSLRELTHKKANDAAKHGILMGVYTINTKEDFQKIMKYPVPALVSNFPQKIHEYLQQLG